MSMLERLYSLVCMETSKGRVTGNMDLVPISVSTYGADTITLTCRNTENADQVITFALPRAVINAANDAYKTLSENPAHSSNCTKVKPYIDKVLSKHREKHQK